MAIVVRIGLRSKDAAVVVLQDIIRELYACGVDCGAVGALCRGAVQEFQHIAARPNKNRVRQTLKHAPLFGNNVQASYLGTAWRSKNFHCSIARM